MKRLTLSAILLLLLFASSYSPAPQPIVNAATDCDTVRQVCKDMADIMYNVCISSGCPPSDCTWQAAQYSLSCQTNNGCPVPKSGGDY